MQVFVPMAGFGERYRRAGHTQPKPLIDVDRRPMIAHVIDDLGPRRPGDRWLFAINQHHDEHTPLRAVLRTLVPDAEVIAIPPHRDGPLQTLAAVADRIDPDVPLVLSYCDYGVRWSMHDFLAWCDRNALDAAMSAYRGFHPHSLGPTLYAYMRTHEEPSIAPGAHVLEIREKHHFTDQRMNEYASSGLFWFRRAGTLLDAARAVMQANERTAGEFYVSTAMQHIVASGARVGAYPLERFFQWGTAEDLADWSAWCTAMRSLDRALATFARTPSRSAHVIPMAGLGERFSRAGYTVPKPLIPVAGAPMIARALGCLPVPTCRVLVVRSEHARDPSFVSAVAALPGETELVTLDTVTDGQATSASFGMAKIHENIPVLVAPCDAGYLYDPTMLTALEHDPHCDLAIVAARGHLPALWRSAMYGWLSADDAGNVNAVAVKQLVADVAPERQQVLTGTFWFRTRALYDDLYAALRAADERVRGEFYVDSMARLAVERGLRVRAITVDKFIPWGTPEELMTFDYWNAVFRNGRALPSGNDR